MQDPMDLKLLKKQTRKQIREQKKLFPQEEKTKQSSQIFSAIEQSDMFRKAKVILLYWSMDDEVDTHEFILKWYGNKTILLPCVSGDDLILRRFEGMQSMKEGEQFSILEPTGAVFDDYSAIELMIIPGMAFDREKNRLGRGRGFYDRLLSVNRCTKIGICFDFQLLDKVPVEDFDVKMDYVFSYNTLIGNE